MVNLYLWCVTLIMLQEISGLLTQTFNSKTATLDHQSTQLNYQETHLQFILAAEQTLEHGTASCCRVKHCLVFCFHSPSLDILWVQSLPSTLLTILMMDYRNSDYLHFEGRLFMFTCFHHQDYSVIVSSPPDQAPDAQVHHQDSPLHLCYQLEHPW